jgi:hypothetical protein
VNILLYTDDDKSFGLAHRLVLEGHQVEVFMPTSPSCVSERTGDGLWKFINSAKEGIKNCQFIIADCFMANDIFNFAKMFNKPVVGWHPLTGLLNSSAVKEFEAALACDCSYPYTQVFDDATDTGELILGWDADNYYIKHDRRVIDLAHSEWLTWAMYNLPYGEPVLIQEQVKGIEVSVIGWFDGLDWRKPFLVCNSDSQRLGASILWRDTEERLSQFTIAPLRSFLKTIGYHGPVKCNLIVCDDFSYVSKIRIGITYPDIYAFAEGLKGNLGDFLWSMAIGRETNVPYTDMYSVAFEVNVQEADMDGAPLTGVEDANLRHSVLHNIYKDGDSYFLASGFSRSYTAMARGEAVEVATGRAYRTIQLLTFPCMGFPSNMRFHFSMLSERVKSAMVQQVKNGRL